jgi:hypothetical protein
LEVELADSILTAVYNNRLTRDKCGIMFEKGFDPERTEFAADA